MASAGAEVGAGGAPSRQEGHRGRGRGKGRRDGGTPRDGEQRENRQYENRGARRGGRGGNRGTFNGQNNVNPGNTAPATASLPQKPVPQAQGGTTNSTEDENDDADLCDICASKVEHIALSPCNHSTCHICALRRRVLYKTKDCTHCRTPAPYVIFTDDATKRYEDFTNAENMLTQEAIGVRYDNEEMQQDTQILLRYNCPDKSCDTACLSWPDLHRHVRAIHHRKICDLCSRHKKVFTHEHDLFTDKELDRHMKKGDDNPGAVDQSGFRGHPECGFCRQRFYGDDELFVHCRERHERCFICDRNGGQPQYYVNYDSLTQHFSKDHYPCLEPACQERRFVVFPSEMDLKAHQLEEHKDSLSKDVRRDARIVNMASLDYRAPYRDQRDGRGRGRGRDPNAEPLPPSSAQPLRRDEVAFRRQLAIQGASSATVRNFGGQLTADSSTPAAQITSQEPSRANSVNVAISSLQNLNLQAELTPQDQARQLRHRAVIERARTLLQNDEAKISQFRDFISSYKTSKITSTQLIDSFFALFNDTTPNALGTLIREVADLYEDKTKATSLISAWNDWRAINEDYPSLPAGTNISAGTIPSNWAITAASSSSTSIQASPAKKSKVLRLKSSTAQSSRAPASQTRSWGTASGVSSSANPFPVLPPASASAARQPTGRINTISWMAPSSAPNSNPSSAPPSRPSSTAPGKGKGAAEFPALPPAPKPQSTIMTYGSGRIVRRDLGNAGPSSSAWGANGESGAAASGEGGDDNSGGKGKKKQGKKVVLMGWG
ncbi:hypothetical protein B0O99DRAFT_499146 [Bisporella sp. PMI_857]|nr:hypothetical protein B0O99DRAFT_499146 [Bisporella sp. PMI_857]